MYAKKGTWFIVKNTLKLASLLVAVSIISFTLVSHSPVDPIQSYIGADMTSVSPEQRDNIAAYWGLNDTYTTRFSHWANAVLHGNLGTSLTFRTSVADVIAERFFASLALMGIAWAISGILGYLLGIIAGMRKETWLDVAIKGFCFTIASTPAFWLGLLLLMCFSVWFGWFPVGLASPAGILNEDVTIYERIRHLFLPALTLSIVGISNVALHTRQKLIDVLDSEFIRFAKAKGEHSFSLLWRHGIRSISLPAISLHFASFGELFGGAVLAEQVFSYPGLGQAVVQAGLGGDVPLLLGIVLFSTLFVFAGNLTADLLYQVIDPRVRRRRTT
ncbi:ABC transporter permease [Sporosarcina sp. BI001-red]|uniref:ABC transporter permease n=1 Tax=Sporosarcina sp. BI001-red TaxID=2282866 RepID=UPI000E2711A2|nr:ABC transporter permease [Sporosarcina sp. BI001-red]REB06099.1 ABC transporter permease [Sporosarcina sp. BI001-red]